MVTTIPTLFTQMKAPLCLFLALPLVATAHLFDSCRPDPTAPAPATTSDARAIYLLRGDLTPQSADDQFTAAAYAGLLARDPLSPLLAVIGKTADLTWFDGYNTTDVSSLSSALEALPCSGCSFALANLGDNSTSAALSFAAASEDTLVATPANAATLVSAGIAQAVDLRDKADDALWAANNPDLIFNDKVSVLQSPASSTALSDLAVKCRALVWFGNGDCKTSELSPLALDRLTPGGDAVVIGWGGGDDPEWGCVHAATAHGTAGVIAADWAVNIAALHSLEQDMALPSVTPSEQDEQDEQDVALPAPSATDTPKHTVSFLMSDGDNVQWVLNAWGAPEPDNWYNSPDRGKLAMGWTMSPSLAVLAPTAMNNIYARKTDGDEFVAGPSGAAYTFPNDFPTPDSAASNAAESSFLMSKSGLSIVNVIADEGAPQDMGYLLKEAAIEAVFMYQFNGYSNLEGAIEFVNEKPVIGGRYSLWSPDFYDQNTLAEALMKLPNLTDGTSSDGYSLIPVHAWSHSVSDVLECVQLLEADGRFDVVLPSELVERVAKNVKR
jgi:hypothetical protein